MSGYREKYSLATYVVAVALRTKVGQSGKFVELESFWAIADEGRRRRSLYVQNVNESLLLDIYMNFPQDPSGTPSSLQIFITTLSLSSMDWCEFNAYISSSQVLSCVLYGINNTK